MMNERIKIAVAGTGYVGLSMATLLSQHNDVMAVDILPDRVEMINRGVSPIQDIAISNFLSNGALHHLTATTDSKAAYSEARFIVIAVPTNYDAEKDFFDTHHIEDVVNEVLSVNKDAVMVIKSTIPIGYTKSIRERFSDSEGRKPRIIFSPEFLREGQALHDNLYPSRIIVGADKEDAGLRKEAALFAKLLKEAAFDGYVPVLTMGTDEAEAVKLFANGYLAMRVAFFNELDTFAEVKGLDARSIITGMSLDNRIGNWYNNPSFGYGGYCFPKDTKQLLSNYRGIPQRLISAIVASNPVRKAFVADRIDTLLAGDRNARIGIYGLAMKSGSDNYRESAIIDIIDALRERGYEIIIYEPSLAEKGVFRDVPVSGDLEMFKSVSTVILANRRDDALANVADKVYTRDVFNNN